MFVDQRRQFSELLRVLTERSSTALLDIQLRLIPSDRKMHSGDKAHCMVILGRIVSVLDRCRTLFLTFDGSAKLYPSFFHQPIVAPKLEFLWLTGGHFECGCQLSIEAPLLRDAFLLSPPRITAPRGLQSLTSLRIIRYSDDASATGADLLELFASLPNLDKLTLSRFSLDEAQDGEDDDATNLEHVVMPRLRDLDIDYDAILVRRMRCPALVKLKYLETLFPSILSFVEHAPNIEDLHIGCTHPFTTLEALLTRLTAITRLHLKELCADGVSTDHFLQVLDNHNQACPRLSYLTIDVGDIGDHCGALQAFVEARTNLRDATDGLKELVIQAPREPSHDELLELQRLITRNGQREGEIKILSVINIEEGIGRKSQKVISLSDCLLRADTR